MSNQTSPVILFDGYCQLCSRSVQFIIKRDHKKIFRYLPLQSAEAAKIKNLPGPEIKSLSTIILSEKGKVFIKSDAVLGILKQLRFPWNLLYAFKIIPRPLRDMVYMFISNNRFRWFKKRTVCYLP